MTRPLSTLGAPAEIHRVPEIPSTTHEASASRSPEPGSLDRPKVRCGFCGLEMIQDRYRPVRFHHPVTLSSTCRRSKKSFSLVGWMHLAEVTVGEDFEQLPAETSEDVEIPDSELMMALMCRLIFAARNLATAGIDTSDYRSVTDGLVPNGNQICRHCGMHSQCRVLRHTASCHVGEVLSILDRMGAVRAEVAAAEPVADASKEPAPAQGLPYAFGEPWRYKQMIAGGVHVVTPEGYLVASLHGAAQEQLDHAERIAACVNFCAGIPTELLHKEKPLADITRDINQVIAVGRLLPGLSGVSR